MNIFLSSSSAKKSIQELDDLRLQKQLVEVYQLLTLAIKEQEEGHEIKAGHYHHPVYLFYKDNIPFLAYYGYVVGSIFIGLISGIHLFGTLIMNWKDKVCLVWMLMVMSNIARYLSSPHTIWKAQKVSRTTFAPLKMCLLYSKIN